MAQKILILNTGGTFASVSYDSGLAPGIGSEEILKELSSLRKEISLELEEFCALDSANIFPKDQAALARVLGKSTCRPDRAAPPSCPARSIRSFRRWSTRFPFT